MAKQHSVDVSFHYKPEAPARVMILGTYAMPPSAAIMFYDGAESGLTIHLDAEGIDALIGTLTDAKERLAMVAVPVG